MQYKTIVLELLQQQTELHEQLRKERRLKAVLETSARQLRDSHLSWLERLSEQNPQSDPAQISSQAMELAVAEFQASLPSGQDATEDLSLDQAMASLRPVMSRD
ncbi:MAG: hypothetical protein JSS02_07630 [Planctomycetes bacterium]|nr:hypothetical protein [Planctomycetota bacterium]